MADQDELSAFVDELLGEGAGIHDTIEDEPVNGDLIAGTDELDSLISGLFEDDVEISADTPEVIGASDKVEQRSYEKDVAIDIDEKLTAVGMMALIHAELRRKGVAGHHIDSMNSFHRVGIKQIVTKVFTIEGRQKNVRDKTEEDNEIAEITFRIDFTDINLTSPTTVKYESGTNQALTPSMARTRNLTYSAPMFIDAQITATAHYKNGTTKTRTDEIKNHRIASSPCPKGVELCNTYNCSKAMLKELEEDPLDPGGYFIIKGVEWAVDNLENISNNTFHVYKNMFGNEIARGAFLSKPGDAFENSYQVILRYLNTGAITVEITTSKIDKFEIPYYLIFRALGMCSDYDIIDNIVYGVENEDDVTRSMLEILERAFDAESDKFGAIRKSTDAAEIVQFIGSRISETANRGLAKKDDNVAKYFNTSILNIIDRYIFPHIGTTVDHRVRKLRFLGHLINKLLSVTLGIVDATDRDSYKNKRVFAAGTSMAKAFKTDFNFTIGLESKKQLAKDFRSTPFSQVRLAESVKAAINSDDLERMLTQAITTGNKTITVKRNEITNRVSSQMLYHKNDLNVTSTLNTINTPNSSASKQNERADEMRRVHAIQLGYIDCSQSADTGEKVGRTKQMCVTTSITGASSSSLLKQTLLEDPAILGLDLVRAAQISAEKLTKVFVNGDWIGCCRLAHELAFSYRMKRRYGDIHHLATVVWEPLVREVYFWTDVGRLMRPLVIVYNNLDEYVRERRAGNTEFEFKQWVKLTHAHVIGLQTRKITMDDLRAERVIEYIAPEEQENCYLSPNIDNLRKHVNNVTSRFTHCDIDQAIFGAVTLAAPMANHSGCIRNTYWTNHRRQSAGWFALNYPYRIDKNTTLQHYCERPLVSVFADNLSYPNGQNTIIALALHTGQNQEDSIIVNQASIDNGAFNASHYNYEKSELDPGEQFGNLDATRTMDIKKGATYEFIKNGVIAEGTLVEKGYALIVKTAKIPKPTDQFLYVDKSIIYRHDEPVRVERVIQTRNDEDVPMIKVKLRANRDMIVGDKMSCLTPDHDVLTRRGWVPIAEVTLNDEVATLHDGEILMYEEPLALHRYDHDGDIYVVKSQNINMRTTMNHRMYVSKTKTGEFDIVRADEIVGKPRFYKTGAIWVVPDVLTFTCSYTGSVVTKYGNEITGGQEWPDLEFRMDDWLEFLGIWISDGNLVKANHCQIQVTCIKQRKIDHLMAVCGRMRLKVSSHGKNHYIYSSQIYEALKPFNVGAVNKYLPEYVWDISQRQSHILLASLISGDGHIGKKGQTRYSTSSKRLVDDIQRLIFHCGWTSYAYVDRPAGYQCVIKKEGAEDRTITATSDAYVINVKKNSDVVGVNTSAIGNDKVEKYVGTVHCLTVSSEIFLIRQGGKAHWTANSRTGNKGIVGATYSRADMPYCEDGLTPDAIVNSHSIPTRMAVNQLLECCLGQVAARLGKHIDATSFREPDILGAIKILEQHGIKYGGTRRMYDGKSGNWIDTLIFIGPTTYQRLQKFVLDEHYAIKSGPSAALTRQPLEGKNSAGGLRLGEMEKDVLCAHGVMRCLHEKFYKDSDGIDLPVCRGCGNRAVVNERKGIYKCKRCGENADIVIISSAWVASLLLSESDAMNVHMALDLAPHMFSRPQ